MMDGDPILNDNIDIVSAAPAPPTRSPKLPVGVIVNKINPFEKVMLVHQNVTPAEVAARLAKKLTTYKAIVGGLQCMPPFMFMIQQLHVSPVLSQVEVQRAALDRNYWDPMTVVAWFSPAIVTTFDDSGDKFPLVTLDPADHGTWRRNENLWDAIPPNLLQWVILFKPNELYAKPTHYVNDQDDVVEEEEDEDEEEEAKVDTKKKKRMNVVLKKKRKPLEDSEEDAENKICKKKSRKVINDDDDEVIPPKNDNMLDKEEVPKDGTLLASAPALESNDDDDFNNMFDNVTPPAAETSTSGLDNVPSILVDTSSSGLFGTFVTPPDDVPAAKSNDDGIDVFDDTTPTKNELLFDNVTPPDDVPADGFDMFDGTTPAKNEDNDELLFEDNGIDDYDEVEIKEEKEEEEEKKKKKPKSTKRHKTSAPNVATSKVKKTTKKTTASASSDETESDRGEQQNKKPLIAEDLIEWITEELKSQVSVLTTDLNKYFKTHWRWEVKSKDGRDKDIANKIQDVVNKRLKNNPERYSFRYKSMKNDGVPCQFVRK